MTSDPTTLETEPADRPDGPAPASRALPPRRRTWGQRAMLTFLVLLTTFAFAAGYIPAVRASRVDPLSALRYD